MRPVYKITGRESFLSSPSSLIFVLLVMARIRLARWQPPQACTDCHHGRLGDCSMRQQQQLPGSRALPSELSLRRRWEAEKQMEEK
ncbi:unnamed protein product [Musa acuminata subsp. burmannicoides]